MTDTTLRAVCGDDTVHVHVDGEGPSMLLLHGLLADGAAVRAQAPGGHRVAWFDQRGHGDGPRPVRPEDYSVTRFVADALAVLDRLEQAEPGRWTAPALTGWSMGAAVALRLAMDHPGRVSSVVLLGPAFGARPSGALARFDALAAGLETKPLERFLTDVRTDMVARGLPGEEITCPRRWSRHDPRVLAAAVRAVSRWVPFPDLDRLGETSVPVGVVGWPGDVMHPIELAEQIAALAGRSPRWLSGLAAALADHCAVADALAAQHRLLAAGPK